MARSPPSCTVGIRTTPHAFFVSTFIPIQALAQRGGIRSVAPYAFAAFIPVPGLHHIIVDAELLDPAVQMEAKRARFITGHDFVWVPLLFDHEQK
jgi:hypothetical protein